MGKFKVDTITFKFFSNDIDCLISGHAETDFQGENINTILLINQVTQKLRDSGCYSVKSSQPGKSYSAKMTGADGTHPDDLLPALDTKGKPKSCPDCGGTLGIWVGKAGKDAKNPGKQFGKYVHAQKSSCGWDKDRTKPQWVPQSVLDNLLNKGS